MAIQLFNNGSFFVQVQRNGKRRSRRGTGTLAMAQALERELVAEMEHEAKLEEAASVLGVHVPRALLPRTARSSRVPTLREFVEDRWLSYARLVQSEATRRTQETPLAYLLHYLGDKPINLLVRRVEVHTYVEAVKTNGPLTFKLRLDGEPVRSRKTELRHATINKQLQCLKAVLNLAHAEEVIPDPPRFPLLPEDDSQVVIPPREDELERLIATAEDFRSVAPLMPELLRFLAETGLRRGEAFNLPWRSLDLVRGVVRVEMQTKGRLVSGKRWTPKHGKFREVPLSKKAKAVIAQVRDLLDEEPAPEALVFDNRGGCPYERTEGAPRGAGKGWFREVVQSARLDSHVTMHSLRHYFAVALLTHGAPMAVVSDLLGHSEIQLTVKRYGRFSSDAKVKWDAVSLLDDTEDTQAGLLPAESRDAARDDRVASTHDAQKRRKALAVLPGGQRRPR